MTTYSETKGKPPINWWDRIERLDTVDEEEYLQWCEDAKDWITCACGSQCDIIPRNEFGVPVNYDLKSFGDSFCVFIRNRRKDKSTWALKNIEHISNRLINEINNRP